MKLLILGGTRFVGRHLVESALARGHEITLFNRGKTNSDLFPQVEKLYGDRDADLSPLAGRRWDAVIDTCGYLPRAVRKSAEMLVGAVDLYAFISTISVYANPVQPGADEDAPLETLADETTENIAEAYGGLKVLCERVVSELYPDGALNIRPGLIIGPWDPTERFTYWPRRVAQGGEVLAPGNPDQPLQAIDGRDLADWTIHLVEGRTTGTFNATGPAYRLTMQAVLDTCRDVSGSDARSTWVDEAFLLKNQVVPFLEMPFWIPEGDNGILQVDNRRAIDAGLTFRPIADTVRDTLAWDATRPDEEKGFTGPPDRRSRLGMAPEREAELLEAWRQRAQTP